jgi:glycosyltransferase involved in cell wall biosynthesis
MVTGELKVLMLGWEFPPQITGGLGTACEGLTRALAKKNIMIHFLMPHLYGNEAAGHMRLYDVKTGTSAGRDFGEAGASSVGPWRAQAGARLERLGEVLLYGIPSALSPYLRPGELDDWEDFATDDEASDLEASGDLPPTQAGPPAPRRRRKKAFAPFRHLGASFDAGSPHYGDRLFDEVHRYCERALRISSDLDFDVIHAHDWMTYPAALLIADRSGKPCVIHVHSLESDRSGACKNEAIAQIERRSMQAARRIIAVSQYTKDKIVEDYGIARNKITVVHNGIQERTRANKARAKGDRLNVLFLGRVTFQKGPDYFVEAALQALKTVPEARFILAGEGDMLERLRRRVRDARKEDSFSMPGFLKGREVDEAFAKADLYVMPSVSEPFGISALEALYYDVPAIVSRQSGISEVIRHALKADFWDVDELANLIIGALKYPELRRDLLLMAKQEIRRLDWDASADNVMQAYMTVLTG